MSTFVTVPTYTWNYNISFAGSAKINSMHFTTTTPSQEDPLGEFHIGDKVKIVRELDRDSKEKWLYQIGTIDKIDFITYPNFPFWVLLDDISLTDNRKLGCKRFEIERVIELKGGE